MVHFSEQMAREKRGIATISNLTTAVIKLLSAMSPDPISQLRRNRLSYNASFPAGARTASVPDIHRFFDRLSEIHATNKTKKQNHKCLRIRVITLLLLLGTKRPSDIVRIWRHRRCIHFTLHRMDVPQWAKEHRTNAVNILHSLGYLKTAEVPPDYFIRANLRPFRPKTGKQKLSLYGDWIHLLENRFLPNFCPVLALAEHLQATNDQNICTTLKYSAADTVTEIVDPRGRDPVHCGPLLTSLPIKSNTAKGLQPATISGIIKRNFLEPLDLSADHVPYIVRSMSASHKIAHGVPISTVLAVGGWSSEQMSNKCYRVAPITPIARQRLSDTSPHDWKLVRAHQLSQRKDLPPLQPEAEPTTTNDYAIAQALQQHTLQRVRAARRAR